MTNALATATPDQLLEQVVIHGDLSKLDSKQRMQYYSRVCESLGLNPLTKPFEYMKLQGKEILYAKRDCADQLRRVHGVSITGISTQQIKDVYVVTATATLGERADSSTGAVSLGALAGDALANALMKAETKAKRRVTLSICGLGWLDETELETIKDVKPQGSLRDRVMKQVEVERPKLSRSEKDEIFLIDGLEEAGPLPDSVPTVNPPVAALPPPSSEPDHDWQKGIVTKIDKAPKPTAKGQPFGTITLETIDGKEVTATWFGFHEPWTYETVREQLCGRTLDVEFVLTPASNPRYKPTLEHFRCPEVKTHDL
jgi:hypothetical protein